jgi:hypothetical protein
LRPAGSHVAFAPDELEHADHGVVVFGFLSHAKRLLRLRW